MRKVALVVSILMVLSIIFTGCGSSPGGDKKSDGSVKQSESGQEEKQELEEVKVTIMHHMSEQAKRDGLKAWTDAVTAKNPNIQFEVIAVTDVQMYRDNIKTKIAAGDPVDIMFGNVTQYMDLVKAGHIADLTEDPYIENIDDNAIKGFTIDGKVMGVPIDLGALVVYYNKDLFKEYNLEIPKTYDEYINILETFKGTDIMPAAWGLKDAWIANVEFEMEIWPFMSKEPDFYKDTMERTKKFSDYPGFKRCLERLNKRIEYQTGDVYGTSYDKSLQLFATGKAATLNQGTWAIAGIRSYNSDGNFGCFALPADNENDTVMRISVDDAFMVSAQTDVKDAIVKFFGYATSPEGAKVWTEKTQTISAVKGADTSSLDPMAQDVMKIIQSGKVINSDTLVQTSGQMNKVLSQWMQEFVADKNRTIDGYIDKLDKEFDNIAKQ